MQYKEKDSVCLCCSESLSMSFCVTEKKMEGKGARKRWGGGHCAAEKWSKRETGVIKRSKHKST